MKNIFDEVLDNIEKHNRLFPMQVTHKELKEYLLSVMDYADDRRSTVNPSFTKGKAWNMFMTAVNSVSDENSIVNEMIVRNVLKEFPKYDL